jgi:hypothetical protein
MSDLLKKLLNSAKKAELGHGIHENCIITKVEAGGRVKKDGEVNPRNCFTTLAQLNEKSEIVGEREVSWFELDVTSEYIRENFSEQILQLVGIMECFFTAEEIDGLFNPIFEEHGIFDDATLDDILSDKASLKKLMKEITENYAVNLEGVLNDKESPIRVKFAYDDKGKYIQQPRYGVFVESMSVEKKNSALKMTDRDNQNEIKSRNLSNTTTTQTVKI